ncbi:PKD domain-containing protein [Breznakibacter xylanolyticus]|uniref:PKD domain-containing protein n=1 Tax=Breznakibacter xylanolyticus TaxID=990 RepID=UPI0011B64401|nr:PKD domain-containing protein [Breznakibacter xylanolyticus]
MVFDVHHLSIDERIFFDRGMMKKSSFRTWLRLGCCLLAGCLLAHGVAWGQIAASPLNTCSGGIYRISDPAVLGFPPGLSKDNIGIWSAVELSSGDPAGLVFEPPTIFQTYVTGFVLGETYKVTWKSAKNGKDYVFYLEATTAATPGVIKFESPLNSGTWQTGDIVYCPNIPEPEQLFQIEGADISSVEFWKTGLPGSFSTANPTSLTSYNSKDEVWGIVTNSNGCVSYTTNRIRLAEMTQTQIVVVGGASACGSSVPAGVELEIQPYDAVGYTYQWYRDDGAIKSPIGGATHRTYIINDFGKYSVVVSGCATTFETNQVNVEQIGLSSVSIAGGDLCKPGDEQTLTANPAPAVGFDYGWFYGGAPIPGETSSTLSASNAGYYQVKLTSQTNADCYTMSSPFSVDVTNVWAEWSKANNLAPFCATAPVGDRTPKMNLTIYNGQSPYEVTINDGTNYQILSGVVSPVVIDAVPEISSTTDYRVISIVDANGCGAHSDTLPKNSLRYEVEGMPVVQDVTFSGGCSQSPLLAVLNNAEANTIYELRRTTLGVETLIESRTPSSPGGFAFASLPISSAGTYSVVARGLTGACGEVTMNGNLTVFDSPNTFVLSANKLDYCFNSLPTDVKLSLSGSQPGVDYQLQWDDGTGFVNVGAVLSGAGSGLSPVDWHDRQAGAYRVLATGAGGCTRVMDGVLSVKGHSLPAAVVSAGSPNRRCADDATTSFYVNVALNGEPPFNFHIVNDKGLATIEVRNHSSMTATILVNPATDITYKVENLTDKYSCAPVAGSGEARFYVDPIPVIDITPAAPSVCAGSPVTLTANAANTTGVKTYTWSDGLGSTPSVNFTPANTFTYEVVVTNELGCTHTENVTVTVNPVPVVHSLTVDNLLNAGHYCEDNYEIGLASTQIGVTYDLYKDGVYSFPFSSTSIIGDGSAHNFPDVNTPGIYTVRATSAVGGCTAMMNGAVEVHANTLSLSVKSRNVSCVSANDGWAEVVASGGGVPYVYNWENSTSVTVSTAAVADPLSPGTYTVTVTDAYGCSQYEYVTITKPLALDVDVTTFAATCASATDGRATVLVTGGTPPYQITWPDGTTGVSVTNLSPGNHVVSVTDANGCIHPELFTINVLLPVLSISETLADHKDILCHGDATGEFKVEASGGSGAYQFSIDRISWFNGIVDEYTFKNLKAGTYTVWVRDASNSLCELEGAPPITINEAAALSVALSSPVINVPCHGGTNGKIEVTVSGGTGVLNYQWYRLVPGDGLLPWPAADGGTPAHATNLPAGDYRVRVNDDKGCTLWSDAITVQQPVSPMMVPLVDITHVSSFGGNDGAITLGTVINGNAPFKYSWSGIDLSGNPILDLVPDITSQTNLKAGTYQVTVTDDNGCSVTLDQLVVSETDRLTILVAKSDPAPCHGATNGFIRVTAAGGDTPYQSITLSDGVVTLMPVNTGSTFAEFTALPAGAYTATVVDAKGVAFTEAIFLTQPDALQLSVDKKDVSCHGSKDAEIKVTISGGLPFPGTPDYYEVVVTPPVGAVLTEHVQFATPFIFDHLSPGDYAVVVTDLKGCSQTSAVSIVEPNEVTASVTLTPVTCHAQGTATASVSGRDASFAFQYDWYEVDGIGTETLLMTTGPSSISGLDAGSYRLRVTALSDACLPVDVDFSIDDARPGTLTVTPTHVTGCAGDATGVLHVELTGGNAPYVVAANGLSVVGAGSFDLTGLTQGSYTVGATDANGCAFAPQVVIINEPSPLEVSPLNVKSGCSINSGSVSFTVSGGNVSGGNHSYRWVLKNVTGVVIDETSLDVTSGSSSLLSEVGLAAGDYILTVRDLYSTAPDQCEVIRTFTITELAVSATLTHTSCEGVNSGAIHLDVTGGSGNYTYVWTGPDGFSAATQDITGLHAGTYALTLKDEDWGCVVSLNYDIDNQRTLSIDTYLEPVRCHGENTGSIEVTGVPGSVGALLYTWNGTPGSNRFDNLFTGTYQIRVEDGQGCLAEKMVDVVQPDPIDFKLSSSLEDCSHRQIFLSELQGGTGALSEFQYNWSGSGGATAKADLAGLDVVAPVTPLLTQLTVGGDYVVTVRDRNNCSAMRTVAVAAPLSVTAALSHLNCAGDANGAIQVQVSGGSGSYQYHWTTVDGSGLVVGNEDQNGLTAGTYVVTVTDVVENCSVTASYTLNAPASITIDAQLTHNLCHGNANGSILPQVSGGMPGYTYAWSAVNGTGLDPLSVNQYGLTAGTYSLRVRDANGCEAVKDFQINEPFALDFEVVVSNTQCDNTNSITVQTPKGGSGSYSFLLVGSGISSETWDNASVTVKTLSNLPGGDYTIVMSDMGVGQHCSVTKVVSLTQPLVATYQVAGETCPGMGDGRISLSVSGGTLPYAFHWTPAPGIVAGAQNQNALAAGTYTVRVTDGRGCFVDLTDIEVPLLHQLVLGSGIKHVLCKGDATGAIDLSVSGGSGFYQYLWSGGTASGKTTEDVSGLGAGFYTVTVSDDQLAGCAVSETFQVNEPADALSISSLTHTDISCHGSAVGTIHLVVAGGTAPYRYLWSGPMAITDSEFNPTNLIAGSYQVTVVDANLCSVTSDAIVIDQPVQPVAVSLVQLLPVTVSGGSNGVIEVVASGGVLPYVSYAWEIEDGINPGSFIPYPLGTSYRVEGLSKGHYRVTVTDGNGCSGSSVPYIITEPGQALAVEKVLLRPIRPCAGSSNGVISVQVVGGTPDVTSGTPLYMLEWYKDGVKQGSQQAVTLTLNGLAPGSYLFRAQDGNGIWSPDQIIDVTEPIVLTVLATEHQPVTCHSDNDGVVRVAVSGGLPSFSGNYKVTLYGAGASQTQMANGIDVDFIGLTAGNYLVEVVDDANGDGSFSFADPVAGDCRQVVSVSVSQPEAVVTLSRADAGALCDGVKPQLRMTTTHWDVVAHPLDVTLSDGTMVTVNSSPFVFDPDNVPSVGSTTYAITSVHAQGGTCVKGTGQGTVQVGVLARPTAQLSGGSSVCVGEQSLLRVDVAGSAPWTVVFTNGMMVSIPAGETGVDVPVTPISSNTYSLLSVSDAHCSGTVSGSATVTVHPLPEVTLSGSAMICAGQPTSLTLTMPSGTAPYQINVKVNGIETVLNNIVTSPYIWTVSPLVTTTYELVSITDAHGCSRAVSGAAVVTVNPLPGNPGVIDGPDEACQGATGLVYRVDAIPHATSYEWELPAGFSLTSGKGSREITIEVDHNASTDTLRVRGVNGCGSSAWANKSVQVDRLPDAAAGVITSLSDSVQFCQGTRGVRFSVAPVKGATEYIWHMPAGFAIVSGQGSTGVLVDLDEHQHSITGNITVEARNACGSRGISPPLTVTISPNPSANAGPDAHVCADQYVMKAVDAGVGHTGLWELLPGSGSAKVVTPDAFNTALNDLGKGANTFRWTVTHTATGCKASDEVVVYNDLLTVSATADHDAVCDGNATVYGTAVPDGATGVWSVNPVGAFIHQGTSATTAVTGLAPGMNQFTWRITKNGCESAAVTTVVNNAPETAVVTDYTLADGTVVAFTGIPIQLCDNHLTVSARPVSNASLGIGRWELIKGTATIADPASATTKITGLGMGENILRWRVRLATCESHVDVVIHNNQLLADAGKDQTTCGDVVTLTASPSVSAGVTGAWSVLTDASGLELGHAVFSAGSNHQTTASALAVGDNYFVWSVTQHGCVSRDVVKITSHKPTQATVETGLLTCGEDARLAANAVDTTAETGFWSIVKGYAAFDDKTRRDAAISSIAQGENIFRWNILRNGCSSSADFVVNNRKLPVYAGKDTVICDRNIALNANAATEGSGMWRVKEGGVTIVSVSDPKSNASFDAGKHVLEWVINNQGCYSIDEVVIVNNTVTANAGGDQDLLGTATYMTAGALSAGETGRWTVVSGGAKFVDMTRPDSYVSEIKKGENVFKWTVTKGGCVAEDLIVVNNGQSVEADAGMTQTVCVNEVELQANNPDGGVGVWSIEPGEGNGSGVFENINSPRTRVTHLSPGKNVFRWTINYATTSTYDVVEIINNQPSTAFAGVDEYTDCSDTKQLAGMPVLYGDIEWIVSSGSGVFNNAAIHNPVVSGLSRGPNLLRMRVTKGQCVSESSVVITNDMPDIPDAGNDRPVCVDSVMLTPNTPAFGRGEWMIQGASTATFDGNMVRSLSPGENVFLWVIKTEHCQLSDAVVITNNKPTQANAGFNTPVCDDRYQLSANEPSARESGMWTIVASDASFDDVHSPTAIASGLSRGGNTFRWTIDNHGCQSYDEVVVSYDYIQSMINPVDPLCVDTAMLRANNPYPGIGTWSVIAGSSSVSIDDVNSPATIVRHLDQGVNMLVWTIKNGSCESSSTVNVINNQPTQADAGNDFGTCEDHVTLSANIDMSGQGHWERLTGNGSIADENSSYTSVSGLSVGRNLFRWTIENNGCFSYDDVEVSYNKIFARVGDDQLDNCSPEAQLQANNALPGVGTWSVGGKNGQAYFENANDPNSRVYNLGFGKNTLRWTIVHQGCESSAEMVVYNNSPSIAYAGNDEAVCENVYVLDARQPEIGVGNWEVLTGGAQVADALSPKSPVSSLTVGDNVFRWIVRHGNCTSTDEVLIVNNRPSPPYAGKDLQVCVDTHPLKADEPEYGQGHWDIPYGSAMVDQPNSSVAMASNLAYGRNVFRWTVVNGQCSLSDEVEIVNNMATQSRAGSDIQDCKSSAVLDANVPVQGVGVWSLVSGKGTIVNPSDPYTRINDLSFGENIFKWTIQNGSCFSNDFVSVFNMTPDQAIAGADKVICDHAMSMNANEPKSGVGQWTVLSGAGTFEQPAAFDSRVAGVGFGINVYQWKISYGSCSTESTVTVVNNRYEAYAGEDEVVYEPSVVLRATKTDEAVIGQWSVVSGSGDFVDGNFFNTRVDNLTEGVNTFRWLIDVNGCVTSDDVHVTYKVTPDVGFISDVIKGCYPLRVQFTNYAVGGNSYMWDFGDGDISVERNPVHVFTRPGDYRVTLTVPGPDGRDGVFTSLIRVYDHPVASFSFDPTVVYVPADELRCYNSSSGGKTYLWHFGDGQTSTELNPRYVYTTAGVYDLQLTVTNEFGCADSMVVERGVEAILQGFIVFPNAFTPRPVDGTMSTSSQDMIFRPRYRDVDQYRLQIFDRWGQVVFESNDVNVGWDGMYNDRLSPQDVYVYKAWGHYVSGREFMKTGSVLLVR